MADIVDLESRKAVLQKSGNQDVVKALGELHQMAKNGDFVSMVFMGICPDGGIHTTLSNYLANLPSTIGGLEILKQRILEEKEDEDLPDGS